MRFFGNTKRRPQVSQQLALTLPAETLRQRADVACRRVSRQSRMARVSVAEAARYPIFFPLVAQWVQCFDPQRAAATATAALLVGRVVSAI